MAQNKTELISKETSPTEHKDTYTGCQKNGVQILRFIAD